MTSPKSEKALNSLDDVLEKLVEDCHGIVMEQFLSVVDKNSAFKRAKAAIEQLIEQRCNAAQIDELKRCLDYRWPLPEIQERLAELTNKQEGKDG